MILCVKIKLRIGSGIMFDDQNQNEEDYEYEDENTTDDLDTPTTEESKIENAVISDEEFNETVNDLKQQMKDGKISFDTYTQEYNDLFLERYNELKEESKEEPVKRRRFSISRTILISLIVVIVCFLVGHYIASYAYNSNLEDDYNYPDYGYPSTYNDGYDNSYDYPDDYNYPSQNEKQAIPTCPYGYDYNAANAMCESKEPYCLIGYTYNQVWNQCERVVRMTTEYEQYCSMGTLINGVCYLPGSDRPIEPLTSYFNGIPHYSCFASYDLVGTMCYPKTRTPSTRTVETCPYGYERRFNECYQTSPVQYRVTRRTPYYY